MNKSLSEIDYMKVIKALVEAHDCSGFYDVARRFAENAVDKELFEFIGVCEQVERERISKEEGQCAR